MGFPASTVARPTTEIFGQETKAIFTAIDDLYRHHGMDANAIIDAAESLTAGARVRHRKMAV